MSITSEKIYLPNVRLSFARLFDARAFKEGQKPRYEATFLLDPSNKKHAKKIKEIKKETKRIIAEMWGEKIPKKLPKCVGFAKDLEMDYEGYEGMFVVKVNKSDGRPLVVDRDKSPLRAEDGRPYSGCYVNANITLWTQASSNDPSNPDGPRVNGNLRSVQFLRDGEAFSGSGPVDADDEFEEMEDADEENFLD